MYGVRNSDLVNFEKLLWASLIQGAIYRIVFDFGRSCYRVEDNHFRLMYVGDLLTGYYDLIIHELAKMVKKSERAVFSRSFTKQHLKGMLSDKQREFIYEFEKTGKTKEKISVKVMVGGTVRDMVAEFRLSSLYYDP